MTTCAHLLPYPSHRPGPGIAAYAKEYGVGLGEADSRLAKQASIGQFISGLDQHGSGISGVWLQHSPAFEVVIALATDGAEGAIAASARAANVPIRFEHGPKPTTLATARARAVELGRQGVELAGTSYDPRDATITIQLQPGSPDWASVDLAASEIEQLGINVRVELLDAPASDDYLYGGKSIGGCTSGFSVSNYGGTTGVLTSAHCGDLWTTNCALTYDYSYASCWRAHYYNGSSGGMCSAKPRLRASSMALPCEPCTARLLTRPNMSGCLFAIMG